MKVLHVISGIAKQSGGPSHSSQGLVQALNDVGVQAWLLSCTPGTEPWLLDKAFYREVKKKSVLGSYIAIETAIKELKPDLIHIHGLWQITSHLAASAARKHHILYVISPRGMLEPWTLKYKRLKKSIAMKLYQMNDLRKASALHATAESEVESFKSLGLTQKVILSPNGLTISSDLPAKMSEPAKNEGKGLHKAVFLSRIHEVKGLPNLVQAWAQVRPKGWQMIIAGPSQDGHQEEIQQLVEKLDVKDDFIFPGMVFGDEKNKLLNEADIFVLPSYTENFGVVVLEALVHCVPVITTTGTPWRELETHNCGKWVDIGVEPLAIALREMMALSNADRFEMGKRGRKLVEEKYTWNAVAEKMARGYEEFITSGSIMS